MLRVRQVVDALERSMPRARAAVPAIAAVAIAVLVVDAAMPSSAHAADLFPVDDWIGKGLKSAGDVVLGPLKVGAEQIARLIATMVGALADLLIPKSLVRAGLDGIRWLVQLPAVGSDPAGGSQGVRMPHLLELRETLTWIGVTLLPFGLVLAAGRAFLAPGLDAESPSEILSRVLVAGLGLVVYEWAWGVATRLVRLLTDAILGLPWVEDGVRRMLQALLVGGAAGSAVASEFVIPLLLVAAGGALLALLLLRVGLEVATALLYAVGGLALGLSVTGLGRRLLSAWLIAAAAVVALPVLWSIVFATGAALMLDAGDAGGHGGFAAFVTQLYNVAAALGVFAIAIKLAQGVFRHAGGAIAAVAIAPTGTSGAAGRAGAGERMRGLAQNATPAGLARFSQQLRGGMRRAAAAGASVAMAPGRHAFAVAGAAGHPIRSTQQAAARLRDVLSSGGNATAAAARGRAAATGAAAPRGRDAQQARGHDSHTQVAAACERRV